MRAVGIDRARGGWIVVELRGGAFHACTWIDHLRSLEGIGDAQVAVDMPMAFPVEGRRRSEIEARRLLGRRASTVFFTPVREAIDGEWDDARRMGVSKQMWNLVPSIHEVLDHSRPGWIEVHPEVVFASLAGTPLPPKKTWAGMTDRRSILEEQGISIPDALGHAGLAAVDDILDAAACALVAARHPAHTRHLGDAHDAIWTVDR